MLRLTHPERPEAFVGLWKDLVPHKTRARILEACTDWHDALVETAEAGYEHDPTIRKCQRCYLDKPKLADMLFSKIVEELPGAVGLNPHLRVLSYKTGDFFAPHTDAPKSFGDMVSRKTFILYLTASGAPTRFVCEEQEDLVVTANAGDVLVFDHEIPHAGDTVMRGEKIILRTDVMYPSPIDLTTD